MNPKIAIRVFVLALGIVTSMVASAQSQPSVIITPAGPTENDVIYAVGVFPRGGFVKTHSHSITGNLVTVQMVQDGTDFGPNPYFSFVEIIGRLPAGEYTVEILVDTGLYNNPIIGTVPLTVKASVATSVTLAIEYFNAALDHYFVTSNDDEIRGLDSNVHSGWMRTGQSFNVYRAATVDTVPVCRYYITPAWGDSHFLSPSLDECSGLRLTNYIASWNGYLGMPRYFPETSQAFYVGMPTLDGACAANWKPVYRLWNARADSSHRYTTDPQTKVAMASLGFIAEGYGPDAVAMCSPP